jgi:hypothetical protein
MISEVRATLFKKADAAVIARPVSAGKGHWPW